jgi:type VI secretion system protein
MPHLQLTLISGNTAGQNDACRFTSLGGSIGRSKECDWTLHDNDRYISNKHILITYQDMQFVLTDVSSNGVFINGSTVPLGKGNSAVLKVSDKVTLGKFCLQVDEIETDTQTPVSVQNNPSSPHSDLLGLVMGSPSNASASPAANSSSQDSLGLHDILTGASSSPSTQAPSAPSYKDYTPPESPSNPLFAASAVPPRIPDTSFSEADNEADNNQSPFADNKALSNSSSANIIPEDWDLSESSDDEQAQFANIPDFDEPFSIPSSTPPVSHNADSEDTQASETPPTQVGLFGSQQESSPEAAVPASPAVTSTEVNQSNTLPEPPPPASFNPSMPSAQNPLSQDAFFELLYDKLGLPKEYMANVNREAFADDIVTILMSSTQGIMSLLAGRSVFKQESRLSLTMIRPQSNNPIKFSIDPSDTLEMLLVKKKAGYKSAHDSYSEALNDIQLHQMAFLSGLQATLSGVLGELAPSKIEDEVNEKGKSFIGLKANQQKWEAFKIHQDRLQKQVNENLNEVLSKHFSDAYEAQINSIKNR